MFCYRIARSPLLSQVPCMCQSSCMCNNLTSKPTQPYDMLVKLLLNKNVFMCRDVILNNILPLVSNNVIILNSSIALEYPSIGIQMPSTGLSINCNGDDPLLHLEVL